LIVILLIQHWCHDLVQRRPFGLLLKLPQGARPTPRTAMEQNCLTPNPSLDRPSGRAFLALVLKGAIPGAILLLFYFSAAILLHLFANVPLHDDWTYAWSVEHFLQTGKLQVLDWSIHYPFAQILWGALFCLPFGLSFSALRVSTVVLAWLGALALYGTLRELGRERNESLIATLVLPANPVFFLLSFSFMTDVPFVSVSNIAFFFIARAFSRRRPSELWLGCAFGVAGFFVRQIAIAIPGAVLLYAIFAPAFRTRKYLLPPTVASLLICLSPFLIAQIFGFTSQYTSREWVLHKWLNQYELAIPGLLRVLMHSGLALFPMSLPLIGLFYRRPRFWGVIALLVVLTACSFSLTPETPKPLEGMWNLIALGKERRLLRGLPDPNLLPSWLNYPLLVFSLFSSALVILKVFDVAVTKERLRLFIWYGFSHFGLIMAIWLFDAWGSDRYSIVLLPPLIVLLANSHLKSKSTIIGIAGLSLVAMLVTWSETQNNRAAADGLAWLRERGIPFSEIDAGYALDGWYLYAHPENLAPGQLADRDVPFVTTNEKKRYVIATSPIENYRVLRRYSWRIPLKSSDYSVYVLEQVPE
jgi:Dolichyl-phosphate-mannose-protein mannosyltransferase